MLGSTSRRVMPNVKRRGILGSHLHLMLVAFIALACISCSFFPKKELNGTAEERPKLAQDVLTNLGSVNATLEVLYGSVARGLNENAQKALDFFVVEAAAKKTEPQQQADLIKTGLEILVDMKSAKLDVTVLAAAINAMRSTILIFDTPTLRYVQELGRTNITSTLNLAPELFATNNIMARTLFTFSAIVERAGLSPADGKFPALRSETAAYGKQIEEKIIKLQPSLFASFQPNLANAFNTTESFDPARNANFEQTDFTFNSVLNGLTLATALQTQKGLGQEITKEVINTSLKAWAEAINQASSAVAKGEKPPPSITIPEKPPALDAATGALPQGYPDWKFFAVELPLTGTLNLSTNPPVYTPAINFGNSDGYRYRACQQIVKSYCTEEKLVTVNRPLPPWTVTLKTSTGNSSLFTRGVELVCEAALRSNEQVAIYTWWLQRFGQTQLTDITARSTQPGRLVLNDISINDRVSCKAFAESGMGLRSISPKDSNILVAMNSAPQDISLSLPSGKLVFPLEETVTSASYTPPDSNANKREVGRIAVTDIDPGDQLANITVSDCDGADPCPFQIGDVVSDPAQKKAVLYLVRPLNFEQKSSFNLTLKAVDGGRPELGFPGGADFSKKFKLDVINQNDPITGILPAEVTRPENSTLTITQLTVVDEDCPATAACQNTDYSYTFESVVDQGLQQDSGFFEIVGRNLKYKDPSVPGALPNFEKSRSPEYILKIKATQSNVAVGDPADVKSVIQQVKVIITDVNEAPSDISLSANEISENQGIGAVVGSFNVTDVDSGEAGNPSAFDYTLTEMAPTSGGFEMVGATLRTKKTFDYEQLMNVLPKDATNGNKPYFQVMLTAKDKRTEGYSISKTFKIYLIDVNESPTSIAVSKLGLPEGVSTSDELTKISLTAGDPDTIPQDFTFSIVKVSSGGQTLVSHPFVVVKTGGSSKLQLSRVLEYNSTTGNPNDRSFDVELSVSDGQLSIGTTRTFRIDVSRLSLSNTGFDENDPALDLPPPSNPSRKLIGSFCVDIADSQQCELWSYALKAPVDGIKIIGRELYRTRVFDFEVEPFIPITVVASYNGSTMERVFNLSVRDRNDPPAAIVFVPSLPQSGGKYFIFEGDAADTVVGTFEVQDQDVNPSINWYLADTPADGGTYFVLTKQLSNSKKADLKIGNLNPFPQISSKTKVSLEAIAFDLGGGGVSLPVEFNLIPRPKLETYVAGDAVSTASANGFYHQASSTPLQIDFKLVDASGQSVCTKSVGAGSAGITFSGIDPSLISSFDVQQVSSASGIKICRVTLTPKTNVTGEDTFTLGVRWQWSPDLPADIRTSPSTLSLKAAFWRAPELNCPSRISLPVGASQTDVPCDIVFNDSSGPGVSKNFSLGAGCQNLSIASGVLQLSAMPANDCTAQITATIANKYDQGFSLSRPIALSPMKFTTNGTVKATARDSDGNIYLGGSFTSVDPVPAPALTAVNLAAVDEGTPGSPDLKYHGNRSTGCNLTEGFNGVVRAIADAGDGTFWVGGEFTHYRSTQVNYLTRLTCAGERVAWYPTGTAFNASVNAIVVAADGSVFLGGRFSTYNGVAAQSVLKLNPFGVRDTTFVSKMPSGAVVNSLISETDSLWVGGTFSSYDLDSKYRNLVRLDQTGSKHGNYTAGDAFDAEVTSLSKVTGGVLVGGRFLKYGAAPALRLAKLSDAGALDAIFHNSSLGFNGRVDAVVSDGTFAYVGGTFTSWRGTAVGNFAKIALSNGALAMPNDGGTLPSFNSGIKALILANSGTHVLVGGLFTSATRLSDSNNPASAVTSYPSRLALIAADTGSLISEFNNDLGFNGNVLALTSINTGTVALVGGEFSTFEGAPASRVARFDSAGVFSTSFNSGLGAGGVNGDVESFAYDPDSNSLYAGGSFTKVGATDASRIVKLHTNGPSVGTPFAGFPTGSGFNSTVRAIAKDPAGNSVYVGGEFSMYDGNPHARLVKLNSNGLVDSLFATGNGFTLSSLGSASVNALLVNGSSLFVGGEFDGFKDEPVGRVVKLDSAGELDTAFDVGNGPNQPVLALALRGSDLFVGGHFTSYAGNSGAQRLARVSALNGELATDILYNINGTVRALAVDAIGGVYAGGSFTTVNGAITGPLARILSTNSLDSSFVAAGTGHLNANQAAGVYTLQPFATADTPPFNMLFTCGLFSAFKYLSSPSANLWQSP